MNSSAHQSAALYVPQVDGVSANEKFLVHIKVILFEEDCVNMN